GGKKIRKGQAFSWFPNLLLLKTALSRLDVGPAYYEDPLLASSVDKMAALQLTQEWDGSGWLPHHLPQSSRLTLISYSRQAWHYVPPEEDGG
ncbi:hypothetical protein Tco_1208642, partial [Tanacetum coccineum]